MKEYKKPEIMIMDLKTLKLFFEREFEGTSPACLEAAINYIIDKECNGDCDKCKYAYEATDHDYFYEESKTHCKLQED